MNLCETRAILLRYHDYGESNRLLTFFTRGFGKVTLDAKGARKSKKRHFATVDLLTYLNLNFKPNEQRDLQPLSSIKMIDPFFKIREDLNVFSVAIYFTDLVYEFFQPHEKNEKMFDDLLAFLVKFEKGLFELSDIVVFQLKVLKRAGLSPNLISCVICDKPLDSLSLKMVDFDCARGGFVCGECSPKPHNYISLGTLKALSLSKETPVDKLTRIKFTRQSFNESIKILEDFIRYNLEKKLRSYEYLKRLSFEKYPV